MCGCLPRHESYLTAVEPDAAHLAMLEMARMVFAFDINKQMHFVTFSVCTVTSCEHGGTPTSVCLLFSFRQDVYLCYGAFFVDVVLVCLSTLSACAASFSECVHLYVCVFSAFSTVPVAMLQWSVQFL